MTVSASARIDGYASGILDIAAAEGAAERVGDELFRIANAVNANAQLHDTLTDRSIPLERRVKVVADLAEGRASGLTVELAGFLIARGRVKDLGRIAERVLSVAAERSGKAVAEVRTAVELDADTAERLAAALSAVTGRDVEVKTVIDPHVVGGVVARIGDTVIDGSVRRRLERLRQSLEGATNG